jgi:DNA mismatch repair ATPase MutL
MRTFSPNTPFPSSTCLLRKCFRSPLSYFRIECLLCCVSSVPRMPPEDLDVNVHPTKKEVHFLHEDTLLEVIHRELSHTLRTSNESRNFKVQTTLRFDRELLPSSAVQPGATSVGMGSSVQDPVYVAGTGRSVYASEYSAVAAANTQPASPLANSSTTVRTLSSPDLRVVGVAPIWSSVAGVNSAEAAVLTGRREGLNPSNGYVQDEQYNYSSLHNSKRPIVTASSSSRVSQALEREDSDEEAEFDFAQERSDSYLIQPPTAPARRSVAHSGSMGDAGLRPGAESPVDWDDADDVLLSTGDYSALAMDSGNFTAASSRVGRSYAAKSATIQENRRSSGGTSVAPQKLVRTDPSLVKINTIFRPAAPQIGGIKGGSTLTVDSQGSAENESADDSDENQACLCPEPQFAEPQDVGDGAEPSAVASDGLLGSKRLPAEVFCGTTLESVGPGAFATTTTSAACLCCGGDSTKRRRVASGTAVDAPPISNDVGSSSSGSAARVRLPELTETQCEYASVRDLIEEIKAARSAELELMLKAHTFVGVIDSVFSLVQHGTRLLVVDHSNLLQDLMYQLVVRQFGQLDAYALTVSAPLQDLLRAGLEQQSKHPAGTNVEQEVAAAVDLLCSKAPLLDEYFSVGIDAENGTLTALPVVLVGHAPVPDAVPAFLWALCRKVVWTDETECFRTVSLCLAELYGTLATTRPLVIDATSEAAGDAFPPLTGEASEMLRTLIYPALRKYLIPHRARSKDHTVVQIAALEQLYKVFERC